MQELHDFIVEAKSACYVGSGASVPSSRPGSHDLSHARGRWRYLDSYFGGTDFIGQETVWLAGEPVWAMNYYWRILRDGLIDATMAGKVIRESLSKMYQEGRFLGGYVHETAGMTYRDSTEGDFQSFIGVERIIAGGTEAYRLDYHGGLVKP